MRFYHGVDQIRNEEEVIMGFKAIEDYLNYINISIIDIKTERFESINPMTLDSGYEYAKRYICECRNEDFHFFKNLGKLIKVERYPKINHNYVRSANIMDTLHIYEYDEVAQFEMYVSASTKEHIIDYMCLLKKDTEGLVYKIFSEDFDEQVTDELGE